MEKDGKQELKRRRHRKADGLPHPGGPSESGVLPRAHARGTKLTLFTVGYQGLDVGSFLSLLAESAIETVVDVRELPLSHKRGFSKKGLAEALTLSGRS